MTTPKVLPQADITGRGSSLNPFVVVANAVQFIAFLSAVFDAREVSAARTTTPDGLLIHAEVELGESLLLLSDPQEGWAPRPGLFQVWVSDVRAILEQGGALGASVVTPPTPFYGSVTLARMEDSWGNLWWLYQPAPGQPDPQPVWEGGSDVVFRTVDDYMRRTSD